jgi:hypothetical protein
VTAMAMRDRITCRFLCLRDRIAHRQSTPLGFICRIWATSCEVTGGVEGVGVPPSGEHALAEHKVDVPAFPDPQAHPDVHLRADRASAHGLLSGSLGRSRGPAR